MSETLNDTQQKISNICDSLKETLLEKNRKYGDSALHPVRVFSKASPVEQILVRLDDKLSRLRTRAIDEDEDVVMDLMGYLVLLKIALEEAGPTGAVGPSDPVGKKAIEEDEPAGEVDPKPWRCCC